MFRANPSGIRTLAAIVKDKHSFDKGHVLRFPCPSSSASAAKHSWITPAAEFSFIDTAKTLYIVPLFFTPVTMLWIPCLSWCNPMFLRLNWHHCWRNPKNCPLKSPLRTHVRWSNPTSFDDQPHDSRIFPKLRSHEIVILCKLKSIVSPFSFFSLVKSTMIVN